MPTLDLPSLHLPEAGLYLAAVMFCPRDWGGDQHRRFVQAAYNDAVRNTLRARNPARIPAALTKDVIEAATGDRLIDIKFSRSLLSRDTFQPRDLVAGLLLVHTLAQVPIGKGTLERAIKDFCTGAGTRAAIQGRSKREVQQNWVEFSPAAHLLAARLFLPNLWRSRGSSGAVLAEFLAHADALRKLGEEHRAPRASHPLLDASETWKLPGWIVLPKIGPLRLPTVTDIQQALRTTEDPDPG